MITNNNYEQYFLLYTDGELSEQEMNAVEVYAATDPKLAEELEILISTKLDADENINTQFDFADLYRNSEAEPITSATLIDLLHGEIKDSTLIESQINSNKILKEEWELLKRTQLVKETIVFDDKELLYRKAAVVRPAFNLWRLAAAAIFIGVMFLGGYKFFTKEQPAAPDFVKTDVKVTDNVLNQILKVTATDQTNDDSIVGNNNNSANEKSIIPGTNATSQNQILVKQDINVKPNKKTETKITERQFIAQKPMEDVISGNKTNETFKKQEIATQQSLVAIANTKQPIKKEIIDIDVSKVFSESASMATRTASFDEDESTILYMKTSKLKDTKVGKAFSKIKNIAKSKIGLSNDVSISFHPVKINL